MSIKESLPKMLALARERTELSRIQLAGMLADVFLTGNVKLSMREEEQLNELINQLMFNSSPQVRSHLVKKFVDLSKMPRLIAANVAQDSIDIARPILVASPALSDDDLVRIVEGKGREHAEAIAMRVEISEAVADALVTTGDLRVMQVVVENLGAHLSSVAVEVVSDAARYSSGLRKPLLFRPEIKIDCALKLYWWVEQDLRRHVMGRFGITSGQIDQALAKTIGVFLDEHAKERSNDDVMSQVAVWIVEHNALTPQILPQVLRMGHFRLFNMLLAKLAHLPLTLIDTIMDEVGGRGLAAICRAIGVEKAEFVSLFLLSRGGRPGEQIVHPRELSVALGAFDRMAPSIAKDLLHTWSEDPSYFLKRQEEQSDDIGMFSHG
ncbi:MAG: DUF2336 domain-containing protein [Alphaproteobacteria bacterium]|nr:DUF2336 domain-containing protein [Alphaproteobacteria bacterium]